MRLYRGVQLPLLLCSGVIHSPSRALRSTRRLAVLQTYRQCSDRDEHKHSGSIDSSQAFSTRNRPCQNATPHPHNAARPEKDSFDQSGWRLASASGHLNAAKALTSNHGHNRNPWHSCCIHVASMLHGFTMLQRKPLYLSSGNYW